MYLISTPSYTTQLDLKGQLVSAYLRVIGRNWLTLGHRPKLIYLGSLFDSCMTEYCVNTCRSGHKADVTDQNDKIVKLEQDLSL